MSAVSQSFTSALAFFELLSLNRCVLNGRRRMCDPTDCQASRPARVTRREGPPVNPSLIHSQGGSAAIPDHPPGRPRTLSPKRDSYADRSAKSCSIFRIFLR